jgi:ribosomal protein S18 acetylase RimI-like enzyme
LQAELLVHTNPDRIEAAEELQRNLQQYLDQYVQEHGPTLHLHFLAVSPQAQRTGRGRDMMQHLVRMADSGE